MVGQVAYEGCLSDHREAPPKSLRRPAQPARFVTGLVKRCCLRVWMLEARPSIGASVEP